MTPSPIPKVLSTFLKHNVKALLIGGQACILYGAAELTLTLHKYCRQKPFHSRYSA